MCGIAGIFLRRGPVDEGRLRAMQEALRHRGPDGQGLHLIPPPEGGPGGGVGLAHTRLAVVDPAGGRQPFVEEAEGLALVANGEVYNHLELRRELEAEGRAFATRSDCEAILHAYARWGERRFLERLEGMFAFALWDGRRRRLHLVRDRLGIKPLYYLERPEGVYFASEPKAILRALDRLPAVDPWGLGTFLQANHGLGERTLLRGLRRVLPGELVLVEEGRVLEHRRWWQ
ncbi:MAG: asparagine synthetase B, partial [Gammaproteobacteria bacterium]